MEPVIEWYESPNAQAPLSALDYGLVDAGQRSWSRRVFLYNNKGRTGAPAAQNLRYTTFDGANGGEAGDVVADRWLEVRVLTHNGTPVADPDGGFHAVGGSFPEHQKDLGAFVLANGSYLELETRIAVPPEPAPGRRDFVHRVDFKFV